MTEPVVDLLETIKVTHERASGATVRDACATIRLIASCSARRLGSPVRLSVAARSSAIARLRRFPSTGADWPTAPRTDRSSLPRSARRG